MKWWLHLLLFIVNLSPVTEATGPNRRPYDALNYQLTLALDPRTNPTDFSAKIQIRLQPRETLSSIELDAVNIEVLQATWLSKKKQTLRLNHKKPDTVEVLFPNPLRKGSLVDILLTYKGQIGSAHAGLFKVTDPDDHNRGPLFFTHLEPIAARQFFPCNDVPFDKALTELTVSVPRGYAAVSNGKLVSKKSVNTNGDPWEVFHWKSDHAHPTYLVSLAAGKFDEVEAPSKTPKLSFWVGSSKRDKLQYTIDSTAKSLEFFEKKLRVKYPWSKYATIGLPTFLWGGMENTSATHMNQERMILQDSNSEIEKTLLTGLVAHELAHQWFGDSVTMDWWNNVWLNESFATYYGYLATQYFFNNDEGEINMVASAWKNYFRQEDGPRSHPIVNKSDSIEDAFDSISYTKGANVLRMLSYYLGTTTFDHGVTDYLKRHQYSNASDEDFFKSLSQVSGVNLKDFRKSWLLERGYPVLDFNGDWVDDKKEYAFSLTQNANHPGENTVFPFKIPIVFHRQKSPSYSVTKDLLVTQKETSFRMKLSAAPDWVTINPGAFVLAKLSVTPTLEKQLEIQAKKDPDALARLWATLKLLEKDHSQVMEILTHEPSPYVRASTLSVLQDQKERWFSKEMGEALFEEAQLANQPKFETSENFKKDPHGWKQYRSNLYGSLGKVRNPKVVVLLANEMMSPTVSVDDLERCAMAVAKQGDTRSLGILRQSLKAQEDRGHRYRYVIQMAFGSLENTRTIDEIRRLAATEGPDLMGKIGRNIRDNQTLKSSEEWRSFLKDFVLKDKRLGDEIHARLLETIEEEKTKSVQELLKDIAQNTTSERIRGVANNILTKNF